MLLNGINERVIDNFGTCFQTDFKLSGLILFYLPKSSAKNPVWTYHFIKRIGMRRERFPIFHQAKEKKLFWASRSETLIFSLNSPKSIFLETKQIRYCSIASRKICKIQKQIRNIAHSLLRSLSFIFWLCLGNLKKILVLENVWCKYKSNHILFF